MTIDQINLTREVEILHRQFFRRDAPHELIKNYTRAHAELSSVWQASASELRTVRIIIAKELNALGIEPWLRSGSERHLLSRKLLLIAYLAECDATHLEFRREEKGRVRSLAQLCRSSALAAVYLLRGRFQKALHGLL
jgi:hypothetical protein